MTGGSIDGMCFRILEGEKGTHTRHAGGGRQARTYLQCAARDVKGHGQESDKVKELTGSRQPFSQPALQRWFEYVGCCLCFHVPSVRPPTRKHTHTYTPRTMAASPSSGMLRHQGCAW